MPRASPSSPERWAEKELENREESLRQAQEIGGLGSWEWDMATNALTWSDELYRIWGRSPADPPPSFEDYLASIHPEDRPRVEATLQGAIATRERYLVEHRIVRPDGEVRCVEGRGRVSVDRTGNPVRMAGTAQDITVRWRAARENKLIARITSALSVADSMQAALSETLRELCETEGCVQPRILCALGCVRLVS